MRVNCQGLKLVTFGVIKLLLSGQNIIGSIRDQDHKI